MDKIIFEFSNKSIINSFYFFLFFILNKIIKDNFFVKDMIKFEEISKNYNLIKFNMKI